jgi:hypothetical protein
MLEDIGITVMGRPEMVFYTMFYTIGYLYPDR